MFSVKSATGTPGREISMRYGTICRAVEDECFELVPIGNGGSIAPRQAGFRVVMDGKRLTLQIYENIFMAYWREFAGIGGP